jgi:glutathione S-transferase
MTRSATATSTHNTIKPLILIEELGIPYQYFVIESVSAPWFAKLNPHKMVPAIEDTVAGTDQRVQVWESTSTLTYLADAYDKDGLFHGRNVTERAEVGNWLTLHTAALGPTAKYWLYFEKLHPERIPKVTEKYVTAADLHCPPCTQSERQGS